MPLNNSILAKFLLRFTRTYFRLIIYYYFYDVAIHVGNFAHFGKLCQPKVKHYLF